MDNSVCPNCHIAVRPTDYFCFNCGKNLKPAPASVSASAQFVLYLKSIILPPLGIWYALPYLKQDNQKAKIVGVVAIVLTIISLLITIKLVQDFMNSLNQQVNDAVNLYNF